MMFVYRSSSAALTVISRPVLAGRTLVQVCADYSYCHDNSKLRCTYVVPTFCRLGVQGTGGVVVGSRRVRLAAGRGEIAALSCGFGNN